MKTPIISHADACRLSRVFNEGSHLAVEQDRRINEWLKGVIVEAHALEKPEEDDRHTFVPARQYPWFCAECGYSRGELLRHFPEPSPNPEDKP